ncbi:MAG: CHAD domain-containing protein [Polyangia bacterium]
MGERILFQTGGTVKQPGQQNELPTTRFVREHVQRLFANLPGAKAGQEEPIHQIRVASRRLRVALPVAARRPAGRRVRRSLKRLRALTRLAGQGRDLDVCAALFDEQAAQTKAEPIVVRLLRHRLATARARAHRKLAQALADFDATRLRQDLDALMARGGADSGEAALRLGSTRRKHARAAMEELRAVGRHFAPMALHAIRRRCRWLRYAAELDRALFGGRANAVRRFKDVQDILGQLHDAFVLAEWISLQATSWEAQGKRARAAAARVVSVRLRDRAQALHRRFLRGRTADWLESALRRNAALFKHATEA